MHRMLSLSSTHEQHHSHFVSGFNKCFSANPLIEKYLNLSNGKKNHKIRKTKSFNLRKFWLLFSKETENPRKRERVFTLGFEFSEGEVGVVASIGFLFFWMRAIG